MRYGQIAEHYLGEHKSEARLFQRGQIEVLHGHAIDNRGYEIRATSTTNMKIEFVTVLVLRAKFVVVVLEVVS